MSNSQTLFLPIIFMCGDNESYKKTQILNIDFKEHQKFAEKIVDTFGFGYIDKETLIYPIMQLYNPTDFYERDIDLFLDCMGENLHKETKKTLSSSQVKKIVSIFHTSTGEYLNKEMQPIFKPLDTLINGDIPNGQSAMLFFLLPIIVTHSSLKKLNKAIDFILDYEINDDNMEALCDQINENYKLTGANTLITLPICHCDFIEDEFDGISDIFNDIAERELERMENELKEMGLEPEPEQKEQPYINPNKTNRNDDCPCGSGKKFKKCCIYQYN